MTGCECPLAGYCERHKMNKPGRLHLLCQTNQLYFDRWENQPKREIPKRVGSRENHWLPLHRYAVEHAENWCPTKAEKWYRREWKPRIPNYGCSCVSHWKDLEAKNPPDFTSPQAFFEWGWARHNDVSEQHSKKPTITLDDAYAIYWRSCSG